MLNAVTVLSLLLCVTTCVLWVRSYWLTERWRYENWTANRFGDVTASGRYWGWSGGTLYAGGDVDTFGSNAGFRPTLGPRQFFERGATDTQRLFWVTDGTKGRWAVMTPHKWGRFAFRREDVSNGTRLNEVDARGFFKFGRRQSYIVAVPFWLVAFIFGLLPGVLGYGMWRGARSTRANQCARCSYDLTGNVSGVCPECGSTVAAKAGAV